MKNILFFILIFSIKLFAYEYRVFYYPSNSGTVNTEYVFFTDSTGKLKQKLINGNGVETIENVSINYISKIKFGGGGWISSAEFKEIYINDLVLLNDLYNLELLNGMIFLNYLYNNNRFSSYDYILYTNYELLYNSDGLVVESIVDGEWAGLYSDSQKSSSGCLYNSGGTLIYYNGEKVSWIQSAIDKILQDVIGNLHTLIRLISTPVGVCVSVVFSLCLVYYVVEVGRRAIKPYDGKVCKRFLEPKN